MNRSQTAVLKAIRLTNSFISTRWSSTTRPILTQLLTQYSQNLYFSSTPNSFTTTQMVTQYSHFSQNLYFSSKPSSIVDLILSNNWSTELENELKASKLKYTHESIMYILRKVDKDPRKAFSFFNWVCEKNGFKANSSVYSLVLRVFANKNTMKEFWIAARKMKEQGFYLDEETYQTIYNYFKAEKMASDCAALRHFYDRMIEENAMGGVVRKVVDVVLGSEWGDQVENELGKIELVLSDNFVIRVLKLLRSYPAKAFEFFRWVGGRLEFEYSVVTYNAVLRVLARNDAIGEFWSVFEDMKGAGHEIDYDTYLKISRQFQKSKMMEDAVKLYEHMMDGPYRPSIQDCCILLRSLSSQENPNLDLVFKVAKRYEETGNSLTKGAYDGIHRSLTSLGKFDEAENITMVMRNAGYEPDNITYSQLVFGLCKVRRLEEACMVLDKMEENGCVPDIKTWTILIQGHCNANEVDQALLCFAKMMEKNCDPDADLLDVLLGGFLNQNKIDGAYKLLIEMVDKARLRPWQATFKLMIDKLLSVRKLDEAMELLRLMKKQNYPPFAEPLVQYISKFGTVGDAMEFFRALSFKDYPSIEAYLHLFDKFFAEGRHSEAKDLLYRCPHHVRKHPKICEYFGSAKSGIAAV